MTARDWVELVFAILLLSLLSGISSTLGTIERLISLMSTDVEVFRRKFCPTRSEWEADIDGQNPKTDMERFCQERARYLVRELRDAASGSTIYVTCEREFDSLQQAGIRPDVAIVIDAPKATLPTVIDGYGDWLRNDAAKRER